MKIVRKERGERLHKKSNLSLIKNSAYRTVSGFPDMEFVDQHNVGVIGVVNMLKKPDFHFSHGGSLAGSFLILDIEAVSVDGVFGGEYYFDNELPDVFVFNRDMIEEDRGGFERKIIVGDKVDNLLGKLPVFDSVGA